MIRIQIFQGKTSTACNYINASIHSTKFHTKLKEADIIPVDKKKSKLSKKIIDLLVFFQIFRRFTKDPYMIKCQVISKMFFQNINVVFVRVTVPNIAY